MSEEMRDISCTLTSNSVIGHGKPSKELAFPDQNAVCCWRQNMALLVGMTDSLPQA